RGSWLVVPLPPAFLSFDGQGEGMVLVAQHQQVAGAAFDHLAFDGGHPRAEAAVGPLAVDEDTAVPRGLLARRIGLFAPLVLDDELVVAVLLLSDQTAEHFAGNS